MPMIQLDHIEENGNMRKVSATPEQEASLIASIRELGVLMPILVRPVPNDRYCLIAGYRRVSACRKAGLTTIPAEVVLMGEVESEAAQAAENMVRAPVDPVDQWRHLNGLIQDGYNQAKAAAALGLSERHAAQLMKLARIAPELLDALSGRDLPSWRTLGEIAGAPHEKQIKAFERHGFDPDCIAWKSIAAECQLRAIPMCRAIFDVDACDVLFEEDLFAEPGSPEQFMTTDLAGFEAAQREAVEAAIRDGSEPAIFCDLVPVSGLPKIPAGWEITERTETLTKRSRLKRAYAMFPASDHHDACRVVNVVIRPISAKADTTPETDHQTEDDGDSVHNADDATIDSGDDQDNDDLPAEVFQITKAGQELVAEIRTETVVDALRDPERQFQLEDLMIAFILQNTTTSQFEDITAAIVSPDGITNLIDNDLLAALLRELLARQFFIAPPYRQTGGFHHPFHWKKGEWIAELLQIDPPRLDSFAVLQHVAADTLKNAAAEHIEGSVPSKAGALRSFAADKMPDWRPVPYGAPGPKITPWSPSPEITDEEEAA